MHLEPACAPFCRGENRGCSCSTPAYAAAPTACLKKSRCPMLYRVPALDAASACCSEEQLRWCRRRCQAWGQGVVNAQVHKLPKHTRQCRCMHLPCSRTPHTSVGPPAECCPFAYGFMRVAHVAWQGPCCTPQHAQHGQAASIGIQHCIMFQFPVRTKATHAALQVAAFPSILAPTGLFTVFTLKCAKSSSAFMLANAWGSSEAAGAQHGGACCLLCVLQAADRCILLYNLPSLTLHMLENSFLHSSSFMYPWDMRACRNTILCTGSGKPCGPCVAARCDMLPSLLLCAARSGCLT